MDKVAELLAAIKVMVERSEPQGDGYETVLTPDLEFVEYLAWRVDPKFPISASARSSYADQMEGK